ncbi:phosphoribosyl-ATP pyrophosphohydrolase [Methanohalophilus levihalophilus]|uniref:phosphoribosyl-ATP diphosphatase n=1 Tax=Methanohalophilus levihalophilus TaxID=1431282 RepID=UPI001AE1F075|nr:phosphoribosyl-ATP diphosphatase [Methanohalophilus levihalophilus]MBP2030622.1 phosphoribosyl-ATP pyrophosphohydrolase [Methanohalophilus levihalophilus]
MENKLSVLEDVYAVIEDRKANPIEGSYVCSLFQHRKGMDKILEKVGEEAFETVLAVKNGEKDRIISETSDLLFHLLVMLSANDIPLEEIAEEFKGRRH